MENNMPTWALNAYVNNDYTGLSDEEITWVKSLPPDLNFGEEEYFSKWPAFGLACNCVEVI